MSRLSAKIPRFGPIVAAVVLAAIAFGLWLVGGEGQDLLLRSTVFVFFATCTVVLVWQTLERRFAPTRTGTFDPGPPRTRGQRLGRRALGLGLLTGGIPLVFLAATLPSAPGIDRLFAGITGGLFALCGGAVIAQTFRRQRNVQLENAWQVDEKGVSRQLEDGLRERLEWGDLAGVDLMTTDQGPWLEDVFFVLLGRSGEVCIVPHSVAVDLKLLERLEKLPGFDHEEVIRAMGSTENAHFVCWRAADETAPPRHTH